VKNVVKSSNIRPKVGKAMNTAEGHDGKHGGSDAAQLKASVTETSPGNVDKIRDILFGSQMRDYETRFSRLEESLKKEASDLRETTKKRLDGLESYIKKELEALEARLKDEREQRVDSHRQVASDLKGTAESIARKIGDIGDQLNQAQRDLRKDLLQQSKDLSDEISVKNEELAGLLDRRVQELRNDKTDRAALASLLTEMAMRLTDEFKVAGAE
jgi:DNA repair exonuclease SbcCD ATPase subunit